MNHLLWGGSAAGVVMIALYCWLFPPSVYRLDVAGWQIPLTLMAGVLAGLLSLQSRAGTRQGIAFVALIAAAILLLMYGSARQRWTVDWGDTIGESRPFVVVGAPEFLRETLVQRFHDKNDDPTLRTARELLDLEGEPQEIWALDHLDRRTAVLQWLLIPIPGLLAAGLVLLAFAVGPLRLFAYDFFICHASEDKEHVAQPLAEALVRLGRSTFYDAWEIDLGDSLSKKIRKGLRDYRAAVVIVSRHLLRKAQAVDDSSGRKNWIHVELARLSRRRLLSSRQIFTIWCDDIEARQAVAALPELGDRRAGKVTDGTEELARSLSTLVPKDRWR